jgi:hypothetical protein
MLGRSATQNSPLRSFPLRLENEIVKVLAVESKNFEKTRISVDENF